MLAADDEDCWRNGFRSLNDEINEAIAYGIFDDSHDWREQIAEKQTPADRLRSHAERLFFVLEQADDSETLPLAARLAGFSAGDRFGDRLTSLIQHKNTKVQDAAAIALGMLGGGSAFAD